MGFIKWDRQVLFLPGWEKWESTQVNNPHPRLGLRNLARELYELGVIEDDSMESLGVFVSEELGLNIESCL